jgi:uncharacterized protein YcbX
VISVRSLHIYPVKSCRGIEVSEAEVVATGFRHDREWMVIDPEGRFLSQRGHPSMARVATRLEPDRLVLETPGPSPLVVPLDRPAVDQRQVTVWKDTCEATSEGPEAAEWLSAHLVADCELVRLAPAAVRPVDPKYAAPGDRVAFADGYPFLLISSASVDELNRRLDEPVSADRFRANIVVDGCPAHAEDEWSALEIGAVAFEVAKPCARCVVITTDQHRGTLTPEPLRTLAEYRMADGKVLFGQNLVHRSEGLIRLGDSIQVIESVSTE